MKRDRRAAFVVAALVALGFVLGKLQTAERNAGKTDPLSSVVRAVVSPTSRAIAAVAGFSEDVVHGAIHGRRLEIENGKLRAIAASAAEYDADIDALQAEIQELRRLGGWEAAPGRDKIPADVIGYFPDESRLTIDAGSDKGVRKGMPVATYEGLVGRIETVDRSTAQVLLLSSTSGSSRISAIVRRSAPALPPAGLIRGNGPNSLILDLADPSAPVSDGDIVVTSGFSREIPRGLVIGKVTRVLDDKSFGRRSATVAPEVAVGALREVLVIK